MDRNQDSFLRLPAVRQRTGLSTATIYRKMAAGAFPRKVQISEGIIGWYASDVGAWIAAPCSWNVAA